MKLREVLHDLVPLNTLAETSIDEVANAAIVEKVEPGTVLFREGDRDNDAIYLVKGKLKLDSASQGSSRILKGGTEESRFAIAQLRPRQVTGTVMTPATIIRIDNEILDHILTMDQVGGIEVIEMGDVEDPEWVFQLLSSPAFIKLPPANASRLFAALKKIEVKADQVVIRQGDRGDAYYLIREGEAQVIQNDDMGRENVVNTLGPGDQFGEEALISDAPRNATIAMKTDGIIMRLTIDDFKELLEPPLTHSVDMQEAEALVAEGAGLLDVRTRDEFKLGTIRNSINIPLREIREHIGELDRSRKYVIFCDTGKRSSVANFILAQRGFDTVALKGNLFNNQLAS